MNCSEIVELPISCSNLSAYMIDDSLFLYSKKTQTVYGFEKGDAFLFLKIDELIKKYSYEEIVKCFPTIDSILIEKVCNLANGKETVDSIEYEPDMKIGTYIKDDSSRMYYRVDDVMFAIHYPNKDFFNHLHPVYEHLNADKQEVKTMVSIDFIKSGNLWGVQWNDTIIEMYIPKAQLATYLQDNMRTCINQTQPYLISLHSASVEKNGNVIVMPAVAESGKTTLTAALVHHGFKLFSDEVTSLDYDGYVHPLPFCMNVKEGSWYVLSDIYPQLNKKDVHSRFDGQNIRFLPPENIHIGRQKASHIVFPKYVSGTKTSLVPISATEALLKINKASYQVQDNMEKNKFELIMKNLISLPKFTLEYSNLEEAIAVIDEIIS